jgi:phosphoribosylanthranilate isomerase
MAQLHGHEDAAFSETVGSERVIKVVRPLHDFDVSVIKSFPAAIFLVDASNEKLYGGTGQKANWTIAAELAVLRPTFLAGGIGPANVREAIAQVKPFGIDVNSAVEREPGRKDRARLELLGTEMSR